MVITWAYYYSVQVYMVSLPMCDNIFDWYIASNIAVKINYAKA